MFLNKVIKKIIKYTPTPIKELAKFFLNDWRNFIDFIKLPLDIIRVYIKKKKYLSEKEIQNYRNQIKIYDIFLFFNEIKLLEIRLNILEKYVDYFVIIEATETFTGLPKKLYFEENKHLFKRWENKIIHYIVKDTPRNQQDLIERLQKKDLSILDKEIINETLTTDNVPDKSQSQWLREFYQKESTRKALVELSDDDFCYISDLDEIWNPEILIDYSQDDIFKFKQDVYVYYLNNRSNENWRGWVGSIATKYKNIKKIGINHIRTREKNKFITIRNGGWHFTFQGGAQMVKQKLESYSHQEINTEKIKSKIENTILNKKDIRGRHLKFWKDESKLPKYLLKNKKNYKELFIE